MNKLSNVKLESVDREKSKNGKGTAPKKIHRKIIKKQTNVVGQLSTTVENTHLVSSKPKVQPKVQQKVLRATKGTVKKSITQSIAKKSSAQKVLAVTAERTTPIVKSQKSSRPIKKCPVTKDPNSSIIDKTEPKKTKFVKRVPKAIPTTKTTTETITMPRATATSHRLEGTNPTTPAKKQPAKRFKRVLKKKLKLSLNGKIAEPKTVDAMSIENVILIEKTVKPLLPLPAMTKQNNILNYNEYNI